MKNIFKLAAPVFNNFFIFNSVKEVLDFLPLDTSATLVHATESNGEGVKVLGFYVKLYN